MFDVSGATKAYKDEIDELERQNDQLAKTLGKVTIERDWAVRKIVGLDLSTDVTHKYEQSPYLWQGLFTPCIPLKTKGDRLEYRLLEQNHVNFH